MVKSAPAPASAAALLVVRDRNERQLAAIAAVSRQPSALFKFCETTRKAQAVQALKAARVELANAETEGVESASRDSAVAVGAFGG